MKGFRGKGILGLKDSGLKALRLSFFGVKGFEGSRGLRLKGFRV